MLTAARLLRLPASSSTGPSQTPSSSTSLTTVSLRSTVADSMIRRRRGAASASPASGPKSSLQQKRARQRYRAAVVPTACRRGYLQRRTVGKRTLSHYAAAVAAFAAWAIATGVSLPSAALADRLLARYFNHLYFEGENPAAGHFTLFGWIHLKTEECGNRRGVFPQATKALKGWEKLSPARARDPMPFAVLCLFAEYFLMNNLVWHAVAAFLQFDLYARPSEVLQLHGEDIFPPPRRRNAVVKCHTVVLAPSTRAVVTKTGKSDCTILAGDVARPWINDMLVQILRLRSRGRVFSFDLADYEKQFRLAALALGCEALAVTPQCLRHGGPSHDVWTKVCSLPEVQKRGQWDSMQSVCRYEKHAAILRQLARLPVHHKPLLDTLEVSIPQLVISKLKSL